MGTMKPATRTSRETATPPWVVVGRRSLNPDAFPLALVGAAANAPEQVVRIECPTLERSVETGRRMFDAYEHGLHIGVEILRGEEVFAHVSPNGRVWAGPRRDWTGDTPELDF